MQIVDQKLERGEDPQVQDLAEAIIDAQSREIEEMIGPRAGSVVEARGDELTQARP